MNFQKRKQLILEKLKINNEVDIRELAVQLKVSEITIRRDLNQFAADGLLYRTHGGAMKVNPLHVVHDFVNKSARNVEAKDRICRAAAALINDGDVIFMDCGSTVFRLCQFIKNKRIKVITNSIPVIYELRDSLVSLNVIGGEFDAERQAVHGLTANGHIAKYSAGKAFLGIDGVSRNGLFANSESEADITLAFANHSAATYLLCDESKIAKETYLKFAEINIVGTVITNSTADELNYIKTKGVEVISV